MLVKIKLFYKSKDVITKEINSEVPMLRNTSFANQRPIRIEMPEDMQDSFIKSAVYALHPVDGKITIGGITFYRS